MALQSGLAAQAGFKSETTWGTPVVVDAFQALVSESMTAEPERLESKGIIAGRRVMTSDQWTPGRMKVGGSIQLELVNKGLTTLWEHMMGDATSPYTPGDLTGKGLTVQIGKPDIAGTVQPFTYAGCKIPEWQLACAEGEIATLGIDLVAKREILVRSVTDGVTTNTSTAITSATAAFTDDDIGKPISGTGIPAGATIASITSATAAVLSAAATATGASVTFTIGIALATASYTAATKPLKFAHGSVTIGGAAVKVKKAVLTGNNGLNVDRFFLGSDLVEEPLEVALRNYTAELDVEFADLTQYRRYLNGTEHAVVLTFTSGTTFSLVITTNVRFDGKTPEVGSTEIVPQMLPLKCVASGADSTAISIALTEQS